VSFERELVGGGSAKYELVSYVRRSSWTQPTATIVHYVALVRKEKSSKSWICYDDAGVTYYARIEVSGGWLRNAVRAAVYLRIDRADV
jgi:hypothetical protein